MQVDLQEKHALKGSDMLPEMVEDVVQLTKEGIKQYNVERECAQYIKKEMDKKYGTTWHVIIGKEYGAYVSHESKGFVHFQLGDYNVILFKTPSSS